MPITHQPSPTTNQPLTKHLLTNHPLSNHSPTIHSPAIPNPLTNHAPTNDPQTNPLPTIHSPTDHPPSTHQTLTNQSLPTTHLTSHQPIINHSPTNQPLTNQPTNQPPLTEHTTHKQTNLPKHQPTYLSYLWNSEEGALLKLGLESRRPDCFSCRRPGPWWLGCLWRWGLRSAMLMSFRRRGSGPSLMMASWSQRGQTQSQYSMVHLLN